MKIKNDLSTLRSLIFESDNQACFIEREKILARLESEITEPEPSTRAAVALSRLLGEVSVPIHPADVFAGRVVEARPEENMNAPSDYLFAGGHMSLDYKRLLKIGFRGILAEIESDAEKFDTEDARIFAKNARIVITAIRDYANRYSEAARICGKQEMASALSKVPYEPAYDFYSALQSIWLVHMIASCYVGARDYAFGRFDEYMSPYYEAELKLGKSRDELVMTLRGFLIKTNEICGRTAHNYKHKPVPCNSSKQYINIGGENPSEFSSVVLEAACANNMPQPQITVLLLENANNKFTNGVFSALSVLTDKLHIDNYSLIKNKLISLGIDSDTASGFTFSACSTLDLDFHTTRRELFLPAPHIFSDILADREYSSVDEILTELRSRLAHSMQWCLDEQQLVHRERGERPHPLLYPYAPSMPYGDQEFVLDGLLLTDTAKKCTYPTHAVSDYNFFNVFCPGIATIGDSLLALDTLVFKSGRYSYREFMDIVSSNYERHEAMRQEILSTVRFGNDTDADAYTERAGKAFIDAVSSLKRAENFFVIPGFYSLERDTSQCQLLPATPDGRLAGERFSENQSPTYGADKSGITALLKSIAKLPLTSTATGALNISFSQAQDPSTLHSLVTSFFELGGLHVGVSVFNREELLDATRHPENYPTLTVRMYGFSEYFVSLSPEQQDAVINRTLN